ncbi:MAG: sulfite exporter TauE/SafE family protein [Gammaproteobacteria bacterium]|nr:sulfite exporter TauE/SafE family protein [Gammaproteobacteria bacterium]
MFISNPWFYAAAIPAVIISGISKGGFGGGLGILSVPIMALVISPVQAAAILLPVLCLMDLFGLWAYRNQWDTVNLWNLIPGSLAGIGVGTLLFRYLTPELIKLLLGAIAIIFTLDYWSRGLRSNQESARKPSILWGSIAGIMAGLTSFIANAGAPPVTMYLLPQRLHRTTYVATTVLLFTLVNYVKLIPYGWLGLLHIDNLATSLLLMPVAVVGMLSGIWLHKQVSETVFYRICYLFLFVVGLKLIYDAVAN